MHSYLIVEGIVKYSAIFIISATLIACEQKVDLQTLKPLIANGQQSSKTPEELLDEISGVWRANNDGTLVTLVYSEKKIRLLFGDKSIPVSLGDVDKTYKTINLKVILETGKSGIWTIGEVWNKENTSFSLQITMHDGVQDDLYFVRKVSTDDLNRIARLETNSHSGAISETAKAAETVKPPVFAPQQINDNKNYSVEASSPSVQIEQLKPKSYGELTPATYAAKNADNEEVQYKIFKNSNGMVLVSNDGRDIVYLGKDGDAIRANEKGTWEPSGDLIKVELNGKRVEFFDMAARRK
jgi:hypothetical protein